MRKNIILGAVAALVLGPTAALAADLPVKAPPPPVVIYDWTGFYIGGSAGGSLGGSNHVDPFGLNLTQEGFRVQGGLVGGTLGYNWQVGSFVVGFEGDASWVDEYGSHIDNGPSAAAVAAVDALGNPLFRSFTRENWLATVRGRAGYAVDNLLFYVTGGYAAAGVEAGIKDFATSATIVSATSTRSGWTGGGGIEWGFLPNWSAKFEWLFVKYQDKGFVTALGDGSRSAVTLDDNVVRFGINYRFGGYGGPVVARY